MTGQGHATEQGEPGSVSVEVRTVNHRGFKFISRISDSLAPFEPKIEGLARSLIHRGSVHLSASWRRPSGQNVPSIDREVLDAYLQQFRQVGRAAGDLPVSIDFATLLGLPGVMATQRDELEDQDALWDTVHSAIVQAIENLNRMRQIEGSRMADSLATDSQMIRQRLDQIESLAPRAVDHYRGRLQAKVQRILAEHEVDLPLSDLLREVQIFADRIDVSEEITRLGSHLQMFDGVLLGTDQRSPEPSGRKLDFIVQEMFRETNTIGSKAADAGISAHVVEIKCAIERMRELVQNLE